MSRSMLVLLLAILPPLSFSQTPTANAYVQHNLVSDVPGLADVTDANLVDPWGVSISSGSPFWVSDHAKGVTTLYNGSGNITPLVVTVTGGAGGPSPSKPTGQVNNSTTAFVLANGRPASFIFVTEDGALSAWNAGTATVVEQDNSASGAVYKGLAIGTSSTLGPLLYAANFSSGNIDVFDGKFAPIRVAGGFANPNIPAGFAPFNIWNIGGKLYVTYAKQSADKKNDVAGAGNGFVSVFDTDGNLVKHLVSNGPLNSPWGVAIAPATFGKFANALLVGNFGNGNINAFDASTGALLGTLQDTKGNPIQIEGLWALLVGNGRTGGDPNFVYFAAGISNGDTKVHGLLGSLAPPATVIDAINAASGATGAIAPGEAIMISGISVGPSPLVSAKIPTTGALDVFLANTNVYINGISAPILYASASQTAVFVPYEIAGQSTASILVTYKGQATANFQVPVAPSAPGLFTSDSSGSGQVVAINQDGSVNSSKSPASAGQVVVLYATGEGATNPVGVNGLVTGNIFRTPQLPVTATIGGQNAVVAYAGTSPGMVSGILQVELIVPKGAGTGAVPVVLTVGSASSQKTATITLQ